MEKERRTKALVVVVLLIVVAGLTVAFAALSATLNINGTAYLDAAKWGIKFENLSEPVSVGTATTTGTAKIEESKSAEINGINVSLSTPGDKVTYTVDLVNEGTINAKIDKIEKTVLTEEQQKYLTFKITDKDGREVNEGDILSAGETRNLTITIEFIKDLTKEDLPTSTSTISLSYKLNFVQIDEKITSTGQDEPNVSKYGKKIVEWQITDTIAMTYYQPDETAQKDNNLVSLMSNGTTETYHGGILVVSGEGDIPDGYAIGYAITLKIIGVESVDDVTEDILINKNYKYNPTKLIIENGITRIGNDAFTCLPINSVEIPSTVTSIGSGAFSYSSLTSVRIPNSVKEIDYCLFYACSNLKEIYLPSGVAILNQEGVFGNSDNHIAEGSVIYVPDEDTKNSLKKDCTVCSYSSKWTTVIVDPSKFN